MLSGLKARLSKGKKQSNKSKTKPLAGPSKDIDGPPTEQFHVPPPAEPTRLTVAHFEHEPTTSSVTDPLSSAKNVRPAMEQLHVQQPMQPAQPNPAHSNYDPITSSAPDSTKPIQSSSSTNISPPPLFPETPTSVTDPTSVEDLTPNVIIFGETGVGKSSLINMIIGEKTAATSGGAVGCTFESTPYDAELNGRKYRLWDTIGLNEGDRGTHSMELAYENLHKLVQNLKDQGVSLLVYCIRGLRIRDVIKINYDLFHRIICNEKVPISLVVTGLENEEDMDGWWTDNRADFDQRGMCFDDHACITTTKGKVGKDGRHIFEEEYNQSAKSVRRLIVSSCPGTTWRPDSSKWLGNIIDVMRQMYVQGGQGLGRKSRVPDPNQLPEWLRQFFLYIMQASREADRS